MLRKVLEKWQLFRMRRWRSQVQVARDTRLMRHFRVSFLVPPEHRTYLAIGERCLINAAVTFESARGRVTIGDRVYIGAGTNIISRHEIRIGSDVTMAWGITIYDHNSHSLEWQQRARVVEHFHRHYGASECFAGIDWTGVSSAPIVICDRAWIGFDVVILKGVTIGEGAVVGARSVVSRDVEPYTVVAGNPAVTIKHLKSDSGK